MAISYRKTGAAARRRLAYDSGMNEIKDAPTLLASVQQYYGQVLKSSADLQTSACCTAKAMPAALRPLLMVSQTRYAPHFAVRGERRLHYGLLNCGAGSGAGPAAKAGCC